MNDREYLAALQCAHESEVEMQTRIDALVELAYQYQSDLRHPPTADSRERRLERIAAVLAKVGAA